MRRLTINGKEYTFKFSIEASLYNECTEATMNMILAYGEAQGEAESAKIGDEEAQNRFMSAMRKLLSTSANVPRTALTLFYAGLLEYHSSTGDNSIRSIDDAKKVLVDYLNESGRNFHDVMNMMMECMGEDHFFELTGLARVLNMENGENEKKNRKKRKTGED